MVILTNPDGTEERVIKDYHIDIDLNETRDFELEIPTRYYDSKYAYKGRVFVPHTEYGGLLGGKKMVTSGEKVTISGMTWRGILAKHVIRPESGQDYKIVSGELNEVIRELIDEEGIDSLFYVSEEVTPIVIDRYKFKRYAALLDGLTELCTVHGQRLNIEYIQDEEGDDAGYVELSAVPIMDYSETIEVSQDANLEFTFQENVDGVNHLICLGQGELRDRQVIDLYVQEDGTIGDTQYFFGLDEIEEVYDYPNVESIEDLREYGIERFKEVMSKKSITVDLDIDSIEIQIGDIVGGRDYVTGAVLSKPIVNKIYTEDNGVASVEYRVAGEDVLDTTLSTLKAYAELDSIVRAYFQKIVNNVFPDQITLTYVTLENNEFVYRQGRTAMARANVAAPIAGHKYYGRVEQLVQARTTFDDGRFEIWYNDENGRGLMTFAHFGETPQDGQWHTVSKILELSRLASPKDWVIRSFAVNGSRELRRRNHIIVDLTATFGEGKEPDIDWCDANIPNFIRSAEVLKTVNLNWNGQYYIGYLDEYGIWKVQATKDGDTEERQVIVDKPIEYTVTFLE